MATVTRYEITDDIDGKPLDVDDLNVVDWSWRGVDYQFDTSTANLQRIESGRVPVSTLLTRSRRKGGRRQATTRRARSTAGVDTKQVREWARENGHDVSDRGRLPDHVVDAYLAR
ncbi:histone-like nucleoid-structuring protein Lsr2 [Gordonia insulae]|uniref:Nucleoid-associated protein Lsr2 n=1 Tax=Gordonia insulae TaxID=2420509 RepID=A0A3G8JSD2_9ACTN|nr:Lsr2 family protein [Gordonia insulae]AZG48044.1 Nucleoid-associated protein Lsr2 [Gordonia insulae]